LTRAASKKEEFMAKATAKIPAPASDWTTEATGISVRTAGPKTRWRAGIKFTPEPLIIEKASLSDAEAKAILEDKALVVTEVSPAEFAAAK
jgi:hypothetical protein